MKSMVKFLGIIAFVAIIGFTFAACDNGTTGGGGSTTIDRDRERDPANGGNQNQPTVTSVIVAPAAVPVQRGEYQDFTVTVQGSNNPSLTVTWSVEGNQHNQTTISNTGRLSVHAGEALGTITVRARSTFNTAISGTAIVTVTDTDPVEPNYTLPPVLTATFGQTLSQVSLPDGWAWVEPNTLVGNVGPRTHSATYTRIGNYLPVTRNITVTVEPAMPDYVIPTNITAVYGQTLSQIILPSGWTWNTPNALIEAVEQQTHSATYIRTVNYLPVTRNITITVTIPVTGVTLTTTSMILDVGYTQALTATFVPANATNQSVTWASNNTAVATVYNGLITAVGQGTATITVRTVDGGHEATCNVTVFDPNFFNVSNATEWNDVINTINAGGNGRSYTINITGDFSLPGRTTNTFNPTGLTVTIQGNRTIFLSLGTQGNLLRIGANQTVVINNLRLQGHTANNNSLVMVSGSNAAFTMQGNAEVSGNTNSMGNGVGGVDVSSAGTFTMNDGTISGNTASGVGGVFVQNVSSRFLMTGGKITGNYNNLWTDSTGASGGVRVTNGSFTMRGGEISNNTATIPTNGRGVRSSIGNSFMSNGKIIGNSGVGVEHTGPSPFTMTGGEISNNRIGVLLIGSGMDMSGGNISDNSWDQVRIQTVTGNGGSIRVSGNAAVDVAFSTSFNINPVLIIGTNWTGGINLDLTGSTAHWLDRVVMQPVWGRTLTSGDVARVTLRTMPAGITFGPIINNEVRLIATP